jgi:hypothetical protein
MENKQPPELTKEFLYPLIFLILTAGANLIVKRLLPDSADDNLVDLISGAILLLLVGIILTRARKIEGKRWSQAIVAVVTIIVFVGLILFFRSVLAEKRTVYFIVDASENMQGLFQEIRPRIKLRASSVPDRFDIGLAIFGGSISGQSGCEDFVQLVAPSPKNESLSQISDSIDLLSELEPHGFGSLQNAISYVIKQLEKRRGVQQIIVITSKFDNRCGELDRKTLEKLAAQNKVEIELIIMAVGTINSAEQQLYQGYAHRFVSIGNVEEIVPALENIFFTSPSSYTPYYKTYEP